MPKAPKGKGKGKGKEAAHNHDAIPYTRTKASVNPEWSHSQPETPHLNSHSQHSPKAASQPSEASSSKRRRQKKRNRRDGDCTPTTLPAQSNDNGHAAGAEVDGAHSEASGFASLNHITQAVKRDPDTREAVRRRMFGPDTNGVTPTPAAHHHQHDAEVKDLRRKVANMTESEEAASKMAAVLLERIAELEQTVATQQADMTKTKDEIEVKEKLIHDHGTRNDSLRELLHCGVCMEPLDDPHTLQCGHSACRKCLHEWFRSPNAYPAADIEEINEDDDLTYRTKTCHMCRTPVFRRPARNIIINHVLESVGLATGAAGVESASRSELDSMWSKIFPPEPKAWVVRDEADNVSRCPRCGCEVDYGECMQCGAAFSVTGSEISDLAEFDFQDRVDLGNGLLLDQQLAALDGQGDEQDGRHRHRRRHFELRGFVDDEAEDDDGSVAEDDEEDEDYDLQLLRTLNAAEHVPSEYDSDDSFLDNSSRDFDENPDTADIECWSDGHWGSDNSYFSDGGSGHHVSPPPRDSALPEDLSYDSNGDDPLGRRGRRRVAAAHVAAGPPSDLSDASYESSFINDNGDVEDVSDDALDGQDASTNPGDRSEVDELADDGSEVDEPSINELRRRRAARYSAPSVSSRRHHSPSPRPRTTAHQQLRSSSSPPPRSLRRRPRRSSPTPSPANESDAEVLEEAPVRRARIPRRHRVIDSDSE